MSNGSYDLWTKFKLCGFCVVEILLDTVLFFLFVAITAVLHYGLNALLVYFGMSQDYAVQMLVTVGTIFLIVCGFVIVAFFAIKSIKEAYEKTLKG